MNIIIENYKDRKIVIYFYSPAGHWNGYVEVKKNLPKHEVDIFGRKLEIDYDHEDFKDIDVHGGLTYSGKLKPVLGEDNETEFLGFDTGHLGDLENPKDADYVREECHKLVDQLEKINY